ncbi:HYC_CC_PP family protein [Winogradskyella sp. PC D3.3]
MKISYLHKIFSVALSLLVLFSTLSLSIEKHFCGDVLVDVAIFSESKTCGMEVSEMKQTDDVTKDCCKNEVDVIEGISDLTINSVEDFDFIHQQVLFAYSYSYINLFEGLPSLVIPYSNYLPPTLVKDIHRLDEVYLI